MFSEEEKRVKHAIASGGTEMLAILPGKHLLTLLAKSLGFGSNAELTGLVIRALNRNNLKSDDPLLSLGKKLEHALLNYLPERKKDEDPKILSS